MSVYTAQRTVLKADNDISDLADGTHTSRPVTTDDAFTE